MCHPWVGDKKFLAVSNKLSTLQIIANHHMQSISFASGGDPVSMQGPYPCPLKGPLLPSPKVSGPVLRSSPVSLLLSHPQDTAEYVAYVAKDPVNQRGEGAARVLTAKAPIWRCFRISSV